MKLKFNLPNVIGAKGKIWNFFWASLVAQTVKCLPTMRETWVQSLGQEDALEKEMAIHSSILPWKIPWTEESGRLQSMGSQTVRYDWVVMEARSNAVKSNIGYEPGMLGPWLKANWKWSNRIWQEWMSTFTLEKGDGEGNGKPLQYSCLENTMNSMKRQKDRHRTGFWRKEDVTVQLSEHGPLTCTCCETVDIQPDIAERVSGGARFLRVLYPWG